MRGQLKLFDLRSRSSSPSATFASNTEMTADSPGVSCSCRHPTQPHLLCTGSQDGRITFWDLRRAAGSGGTPVVSVFRGHEGAGGVNEVQFHPQQPGERQFNTAGFEHIHDYQKQTIVL